jgi:1,4-alpha-glucan branching enzyme
MTLKPTAELDRSNIAALIDARHVDPFAVLGPHNVLGETVLRALVPRAERLEVLDSAAGTVIATLARIDPAGIFEGAIPGKPAWFAYRLRATNSAGSWEFDDPYRFGPVLGELDDYLIGEGTHRRLWEKLGSHVIEHAGVTGAHFAVWAPNASRVSVVGDFNEWDGRRHPMRKRMPAGVWEIFIPGLGEGTLGSTVCVSMP